MHLPLGPRPLAGPRYVRSQTGRFRYPKLVPLGSRDTGLPDSRFRLMAGTPLALLVLVLVLLLLRVRGPALGLWSRQWPLRVRRRGGILARQPLPWGLSR